jgi:hypothetical protein
MATTAETITLKQFGSQLAEKHKLSKRQVDAMLSDMVRLIGNHLREGSRVRIRGLGDLLVRAETADPPNRGTGGSAAQRAYRRYIIERVITVDPQHAALEKAFNRFLAEQGASEIIRNKKYVDVRFRDREHGPVIAELKPAKPNETCYAIRTAIGQVLEYRHYISQNKELPMIVLGAEPKPREKDFVSSIGIALGWQSGTEFEINWPKLAKS